MSLTVDLYKAIFQQSSNGLVICKILFDHSDLPVDYLFEEINPLIEQIIGLPANEIIGKRLSELNAGIKSKIDPEWLVALEKTAKGQAVADKEYFAERISRWYKVHFLRIHTDILAIQLTDISKETEQIIDCLETDYKLRIESRLRELVTEIATTYVNLPLNRVDATLNKSLADMALFVHADRAYIFDYEDHTEKCTNTYEWCGDRILPQLKDLQDVPLAAEWIEAFRKGQHIYIGNVSELPPGLAKEVLLPQGIKSLFAIPMMLDTVCIGFVGFDFVHHHHEYSENEFQILRIFAQMFVNIKLRKKAEEELVKAKEVAEENDKMKSAFLANMSHEIRTPMNGILGFTQILKDPELNEEERQEYIQIIEHSGQRMLNVINDLINISKIEAGQMQVLVSKININEQLGYLYTFFNPEAIKKKISLSMHLELPKEQAYIETDREKVYAILTNLLKNALKFTDSGKIEFGYSINIDVIEFFVKDTGIGIPENKITSIFDRFVQAGNSNTNEYEGSGLGLAISKAYVELLGGSIWLESDINTGTTFRFAIPYQPAKESIYRFMLDQPPHDLRVKPSYIHALIVDNDRVSRLTMIKMMEKFCDTFVSVQSGSEAVEICQEKPQINLVLMDIKMPGMDGYEATTKIREFNKSIVIIAQTTLNDEIDRIKALKAGCNEYITKPIQPATLSKLISKHFSKH